MKITISPQKDSSITEKIDGIDLAPYTIFAGENNAGKTHLMNAIQKKIKESKAGKVIYIPAEKINAEEQMKTSAISDPMHSAIAELINITVKSMPKINYKEITELFSSISETFKNFDVIGAELQLTQKKLTKDDVKKSIHDAVVKKVLEAKVLDTHDKSKDSSPLAIGDASQGTQRLIVASVIQELGKVGVSDDEIFILFEEPEIYLHPRLKKSLYEALSTLSRSKNNNINIIISTHDPYFIELGSGQKIYEVFRNPEKNYSTDVKEMEDKFGVLNYRSDAEINYLIFGVVSTDYFLQLYQKAEEPETEVKFKKEEIKDIKIFDIRRGVAHKTKKSNRETGKQTPEITEDVKKGAIKYLRDILQQKPTS